MKIGFTGTQRGMNPDQKLRLIKLLVESNATEFHHGDCIGADEEAHKIAVDLGLKIVIHPPNIETKRAFCTISANVSRTTPKPYLERNHDIVNETKILFAAPKESKEVLRSGTWATIRYARKTNKTVYIL